MMTGELKMIAEAMTAAPMAMTVMGFQLAVDRTWWVLKLCAAPLNQ